MTLPFLAAIYFSKRLYTIFTKTKGARAWSPSGNLKKTNTSPVFQAFRFLFERFQGTVSGWWFLIFYHPTSSTCLCHPRFVISIIFNFWICSSGALVNLIRFFPYIFYINIDILQHFCSHDNFFSNKSLACLARSLEEGLRSWQSHTQHLEDRWCQGQPGNSKKSNAQVVNGGWRKRGAWWFSDFLGVRNKITWYYLDILGKKISTRISDI